jgi:plastocyanin
MDTDEHFMFTFSKAGTYKYFCSIHPHMTGTVIVK